MVIEVQAYQNKTEKDFRTRFITMKNYLYSVDIKINFKGEIQYF